MSKLIPDIFPRKKEKTSYFIETPIDKIVEEIVTEPPKIKTEDLIENIDEYSKGFTDAQRELFKYMLFTTKLTKELNDSVHFLHLFNVAFVGSLKKTFPDKNFDEIEKGLNDIKISLEKNLKDGNLPNTTFMHCLLGVIRGLL